MRNDPEAPEFVTELDESNNILSYIVTAFNCDM